MEDREIELRYPVWLLSATQVYGFLNVNWESLIRSKAIEMSVPLSWSLGDHHS